MPYYHVHAIVEDQVGECGLWDSDFNLEQVGELVRIIKRGLPILLGGFRIKPYEIRVLKIWKTEKAVLGKAEGEKLWSWIKNHGEDVTRDFARDFMYNIQRKDIFIVHGRDHKPIKELKAMLEELGLNPVVLHEQPSGSRTIVEKLEKYSGDIGYAFVILTPDDVGTERKSFMESTTTSINNTESVLSKILMGTRARARQNVVLEFGYFIGKLNRDRVCCLYKGNIELPSDMHGIVYISFKESVNEVRDKIVKELKAAGYEIKI